MWNRIMFMDRDAINKILDNTNSKLESSIIQLVKLGETNSRR